MQPDGSKEQDSGAPAADIKPPKRFIKGGRLQCTVSSLLNDFNSETSPDDVVKIVAYARASSIAKAAAAYNISTSTVHRWMKNDGVVRKRGRPSKKLETEPASATHPDE